MDSFDLGQKLNRLRIKAFDLNHLFIINRILIKLIKINKLIKNCSSCSKQG